ncbi:phosphatidic acid phosphatase type 2/haloperoxidase [Pelagophyceae sp. CCMP2097]|nr:phosphatidic acid phosphatase type 2/haloperoxidase [Pelagophyceae sp. CCMP2097]
MLSFLRAAVLLCPMARGLSTSSRREPIKGLSPRVAAAAATTGFALATLDVFGTHVLLPDLDAAARSLAGADADYHNAVGRTLSDVSPAFVFLTATACAATCRVDARRAAAVAGTWFLVLNPVILALKGAFHRTRPDQANHHDWSFPSGHTGNAAFLSVAFFGILLPRLLEGDAARPDDEDQLFLPTSKSRNGPAQAAALAAVVTVSVASGRVLTESHWASDTIAGACLGVAAASLAAALGKSPAAKSDLDVV